jgi:hypothetical protein
MKKISFILPTLLAVTLLGASCTTTTPSNQNTNAAAISYAVSYAGQDGQSALDLLKKDHQVEASAEGFVSSIDSQKPGDHQYWALYLNGTLADTGAKDLVTKNGDQLGWRLDSF